MFISRLSLSPPLSLPLSLSVCALSLSFSLIAFLPPCFPTEHCGRGHLGRPMTAAACTHLTGEIEFNGLDADVLRTGSHGFQEPVWRRRACGYGVEKGGAKCGVGFDGSEGEETRKE
ncbi:hypothetical protein F5Y09DRAFT_255804 [Xylaria sp. FL1042]|nr:hypothetical protein F5Y09DRAFT_255804 [Xylaria sp. FL1042]